MQLRLVSAAGALLAALVLAGCGSDAERSVPAPNIATVTGSGREVDIEPDVQRADFPNACKLLPADSVATLLEAPATAGKGISGCSWSTGLASFPSLTVTWMQVGNEARSDYEDGPGKVTDLRSLPGVGDDARIYRIDNPVSDNKVVYVDVLKSDVYFQVTVGIVTSSSTVLARSEAIAGRVAQLVAQQVV